MASSNYGVMAVIQPPSLNSVDQPSLIKFETAFAAYRTKVEDVNKDREQDSKLSMASVKDCIDAEVLHALCVMGDIEGAPTLEEATVEKVQAWFEKASSSSPKDLSERIDSTLRSLSYNPNKEDPAGGVSNFIISVITFLGQNNVSEILKVADMAKKFLDRLVTKFQPDILQKRIKMMRRGRRKEQLASIKLFRDEVSGIALELSLTETARARVKPRKSHPNRNRVRRSDESSPFDKPSQTANRRTSKRKESDWNQPCLNEDCGGVHRLKDCQITSPEKMKEIFEKHYRDKKAKKAKTVKQESCASTTTDEGEDSRFRVALEDTVFGTLLGDSGADFSAIDCKTFQKVSTAVPDLFIETLAKPLTLEGAFKTDTTTAITSSQTVTLAITIYLPGSNIPVRVRGIEFYIVDHDLDEILLGRPFLNTIGFNLKDHLNRVRHNIHDKHILDIDPDHCKLAAATYRGLSYMAADDDPIELPECLAAGIGEDTKESLDHAFLRMVREANDNGMTNQGAKKLSELLEKYRDVFRIKLGSDPPVDVPPLTITRTENAKHYRSPQRRYAPQQRDFIIQTIRELEEVGAIYKNPSARWASPALAVPKPGSTKLRFTVDLRAPNARTVPIQSAMPHLESKFQDIAGSTCSANIDLAHGYWQVPLSPESQEIISIQTPLGGYSSKRLLQGRSDSGNHFQAILADKFDGQVDKMLQWIDDFLFYAKDETELLTNLESFFSVCKDIGLKVHAEKSTLFAQQVHFCGRIISAHGVQYHPRHFESLASMKTPTMASELQQFVFATNWMRNAIPAFAQKIAPLHNLLEDCYSKAGKRTKQALRNLSLSSSWGASHDSAFADIKNQLAASVKLSYPKPGYFMCLFTDASDSHWAAILTQVPLGDRNKVVEEQRHEPLCFLSGVFSGSSANWSVPEKEGYAIVEAICRLDYLVIGHEVNIFTDHANLVYLYDPYGKNPGIARHTASKLMRWAIKLSAFRYVVEHLPGDRNVWADMLTSWAVNCERRVRASSLRKAMALMFAPINPGSDAKFDWPTIRNITHAQHSAIESPPKGFQSTADGIRNDKEVLWVPSDADILKLRIAIAAHTGHGGHRAVNVTLAATKAYFFWKNMDDDLKRFVDSCLHCVCTQSGKTIPRLFGHALHADHPNELLHFDFCYMARAEDDYLYVLVFKDDHSGYVWFIPATETTADVVAEAMIKWFAAFGVVNQWVSDRGSHFKNDVVRLLKEKPKSAHHFTLAYCPWSNGTVEVVCRELLRTCRALLSEYQLPHSCWPSVLPVVQSVLNNTILERLGNRCPLTVFTGHKHDSPLSAITRKVGKKTKVLSIDSIRFEQLSTINAMQGALESMHKHVAVRSGKKRQQTVDSHNRKTNFRAINFTEGDFILRVVQQREHTRKPSLKWLGPYRVQECRSGYILLIQSLLEGSTIEVHGRRLKLFRNQDFEVTEELLNYLAYQEGEFLVIDRFLDIRRKRGTMDLLVKWRGFNDESDWVALSSLRDDVPVLVEEFLSDTVNNGTQRQRTIIRSL